MVNTVNDRHLRLYEEHECGEDGYPFAWHRLPHRTTHGIKDIVRLAADSRCVRCGHPYEKGEGEWSNCDIGCTHDGPVRYRFDDVDDWVDYGRFAERGVSDQLMRNAQVQARWRILTVHHLNNVKADCRWWNLVALCQRCHLTIQGKVRMNRPYDRPHTEWFVPYVCGFYAFKYFGEEINREQALARREELLMLELRQGALFT